ncbi:hypothetical protein ACIRNI_20530, partial [Streptomyces sp. NPDC093546]
MRSARIVFASATVTAALAITAPAAYAFNAGDRDKGDSSYSSEHHEKKDEQGKPRGGVHAGGGLLATTSGD